VRNAILSTSFVLAAIVAAVNAQAAPATGVGGITKPNKLPVTKAFAHKMNESVQKAGQPKKTRAEILAMFDADAVETLANGQKVTAQQLIDKIDKAEADLKKDGSGMHKMPDDNGWMEPDIEATQKQQKLESEKEQQALASAPTPTPTPPPATPSPCTLATCKPADTKHQVGWNKTLGKRSIVAAYTDFKAQEQTPSSTTAQCTATWDNGVHLLNDQRSIVRFVGESNTQTGASPSASGKASLYVLGAAQPVWSKSGKFSPEKLDRTFKTSKDMSYTIVPGVYLKGKISASATLGLTPAVQSEGTAAQARCGIDITPALRADVVPEVSLHVGIPHVADVAEGGLKANISLLDAHVPTQLDLAIVSEPAKLDLTFRSNLDVVFLKGNLVGWYKIHDICHWGYCLLEDGLGIKTHGEIALWKGDGMKYNAKLVDIHGPIALLRPGEAPPSGGGFARGAPAAPFTPAGGAPPPKGAAPKGAPPSKGPPPKGNTRDHRG
jgi:hypothetical protein